MKSGAKKKEKRGKINTYVSELLLRACVETTEQTTSCLTAVCCTLFSQSDPTLLYLGGHACNPV